jgi:phosphoglycolate phosphatase-like HAD superfamily hydrolase
VGTRAVLFDIDGTLVLTGGAGARAMMRTFEEVFGARDPAVEVPFAGRTDTWIVSELARRHGYPCDDGALLEFRDRYVNRLATEILQPGPRKGVLPGVRPLLEALAERRDVSVALLTGNFEGGARVKLEHFDLWRYFLCGAFAEDAPDRNALFGSAMTRIGACGVPIDAPSDVVIVGDTPLDVAVAVAAGARSVAVATGTFRADELRAAGADAVLEDLSDLAGALGALGMNA